MKIMPVQKVSAAGQITRFKAFVAVGDESGHVGLGVKCAKEVGVFSLNRTRSLTCWLSYLPVPLPKPYVIRILQQ